MTRGRHRLHARPRRHPIAAVLFVILTVIAVMASTAMRPTALAKDKPADMLYNWNGATPIGITLSGLQHYVLTPGSIRSIESQISTARSWGANTIRLQIVQDRLVGRYGNRFDVAYMDDVESLVSYGRSRGMTMVLNAQTEKAPGFTASEPMPTHATRVFWRRMMDVYANKRGIVFDLFNEPRQTTWAAWRINFQSLVNMVRKHARNTIWLEGIRFASTLAGMPFISGTNLVYTYHHPGAPWQHQSPNDAATWNHAFGNLAIHDEPVVDGEYTNDHGTYWLPHRTVRAYLKYAKAHHIGMITFGTGESGHSRTLLKQYMED